MDPIPVSRVQQPGQPPDMGGRYLYVGQSSPHRLGPKFPGGSHLAKAATLLLGRAQSPPEGRYTANPGRTPPKTTAIGTKPPCVPCLVVQLHKHATARGSPECRRNALPINLRWNKQYVSHFHGHFVRIEACRSIALSMTNDMRMKQYTSGHLPTPFRAHQGPKTMIGSHLGLRGSKGNS